MMKKLLVALLTVFLMASSVPVNAASKKVIYLTFDDGPSKQTPKILKVLKKYNVKATFFVIGARPKCYKYIGQAYKQGHCIAAHSYTHNYNIYKSQSKFYKDLGKIEKVIKKQTGKTSKVIRFPGGSSNTISRKYKKHIMKKLTKSVMKKGYRYYDWNVDSTDASGNNVKASKIVKRSKSKKKKICLLMHDAVTKKTTVKALPKVIKYYKKKGYTFKTLDQAGKNEFHHYVNN
ncbi:MAG: polysaccharide deacetylase [Erysipelotrichaceae bacterium]|nr:polysaccharide deacetylase [Erysipelotrichaceae bacterium]